MTSSIPDPTTTISPGSAAQNRNKIWLRGGLSNHFARMMGYLLLIPVYLAVQAVSALAFGVFWSAHIFRTQLWSRKPLWGPALLFLLTGAILLGFTLYGPPSVKPPQAAATKVVLERGLGVQEIAARLTEAKVIPSTIQFLFLAKLFGVEDALQAGKYSFPLGIKPLGVLNSLTHGGVTSQMITIPEGLTIRQMAHLLEGESGIDAQHFMELAHDPQVVREHHIEAPNLEGYLFPDTYGLYWAMPARKVIDILVSRFHQVFDMNMDLRAQELGMSLHQIITLASMIEEEAMIAEERPLISAVYHNRLRKRMLLQCDPTVIYALGEKEDPLTHQDLEVDSPYNTYRHYGLPPGAISNPGKAAIEAALYPADVDYLYFVAHGDGSHHFSRTSQEHINAKNRIKKNLGN